MSTVELHDQAVWQAWVAKGRARERRGSATRLKVVELVATVALIIAAALWPVIVPFDVVIRFVVALGAIAVILQAFHARNYAVATVYGAMVLLYNPVAPIFDFAGGWQRVVVVASVIPFITSLASRGAKAAHTS